MPIPRIFLIALAPISIELLAHTPDPSISGRSELRRSQLVAQWQRHQPKIASASSMLPLAAAAAQSAQQAPATAKPFLPFTKLDLHADAEFLWVGSNGLPDHDMMVGITAWQQQLPLPQDYRGDNAWRLPLKPRPASKPAMLHNQFLRGAVALAVNGVPIFNPQNNRGEVAQEIGELDQWGGHCGRADDYHYHIAPLHLQAQAGVGMPIAFGLDGYPLYGPNEPKGGAPRNLDLCHGHEHDAMGYHYHASLRMPYVMAGFHGEVGMQGDGVEPQPRAQPLREALQALRGASINEFKRHPKGFAVGYKLQGQQHWVRYEMLSETQYRFEFIDGRGQREEQLYNRRSGGGADRPKGQARQSGRMPRASDPDPAAAEPAAAPQSPVSGFQLSSPAFGNGGTLPLAFSGNGAGQSPPLQWKGEPVGTRAFALLMEHTDREGEVKSYWLLANLPASLHSLAANAQGVGAVGSSFRGKQGYEPPHSRGPGLKTYTLRLFALSKTLSLPADQKTWQRQSLLQAMQGLVLGSAVLEVTHDSSAAEASAPEPTSTRKLTPTKTSAQSAGLGSSVPVVEPARPKGGKNKNEPKGKAGGLIKPSMDDTLNLNVYADNWFMLYINGRLAAVDSIPFTPHNVISVQILPEYPMTIAILAKDNADPTTGLEYGSQIGDAGLCLKFSDGTVSNARWKAKSFFHGPMGGNTQAPKVSRQPLPPNWWAVDFDDRAWPQAKTYSTEEVDPKAPFFEADFQGASFIWSEDLALDNTVIFRTRIDKPGWKARWNTQPDLDVSKAPQE
jgi:hypothetical protein